MDDDVWGAFEKSVAYMTEVAALYQSAFGVRSQLQREGAAPTKKIVAKAHLDEAHNQAQQALELLASNLLNASMAIVNGIEKQEQDADRLKQKVAGLRQSIRDRQAELDEQAIDQFYSAHTAQESVALPDSSSPRFQDDQLHHAHSL